jgi:hypothetical protein
LSPISIILFCGFLWNSTKEGRSLMDEKSDASLTAQVFVKRQLSFPEEANFHFGWESQRYDDGSWIVTGDVTAKNAFGMRSKGKYRVHLIKHGNQWQALDVQLTEDK